MVNNEQDPKDPKNQQKIVTRKADDLELKKKILSGPELFITEKGSDESLDRLSLKIKLIGGQEFTIAEYVSENLAEYEPKFKKYWFYKLADLYRVNKKVMDSYVKPDFVRLFIIQFVYGRFPYMMLRRLRSNKIIFGEDNIKLFQYLTPQASEQLDIVIQQVYEIMCASDEPMEFKLKYSKAYKVYFQTELFT